MHRLLTKRPKTSKTEGKCTRIFNGSPECNLGTICSGCNKELSYTVTTALTGGESHADPLIQEMRDDLKGIKLQIKEQMNNTINAVEITVDPNATGRRMATRFCGYCRTNGHTPNWCRKKMRDEEVKKVQNEANTEE